MKITCSRAWETVREVIEDVTFKTTWTDDNRSYHVSSKKIADVLGFTARHTIKDAVSDIKNAFEKGLLQNSMETKCITI